MHSTSTHSKKDPLAASYDILFESNTGEIFQKGDLKISSTGLQKSGQDRAFTVIYEDLEIGDVIGRGCSSVVVQARHKLSNIPLALKVINMFDKAKRDQLLREINALYNARCPSLIEFYGAFYREGAITIALEYMDGGSLANVLQQVGPIPERVLANMTFQVLWGLAYLRHEHRVHRDIKPSNLLINSEGRVKVTDFGVSSELQNSLAMCGTFVGSFKYMSPERIRSEQYSYLSDIWSLALVIFECATGEYPYVGDETAIGMVQMIVLTPEPRLDPTHYSREFCQFIEATLVRDPKGRLQADVLMGSSWFAMHGARSLNDAIENVRHWIDNL